MKEIPTTPPSPNTPTAQDFILGLANQVVPHTGSWRPLATAVNYLVRIVPIVYMAFQAWPTSPVRVQPDSGMGCDNMSVGVYENNYENLYPRQFYRIFSGYETAALRGDQREDTGEN
ncbi:hypothetical protein DSO57_1006320 [Entomophthora muscae]|uniref:Uncharacterized protein n=1 Tax=Entomophthora muscae TaxID=34485 RepID=A0ACC2T802_9FUNG|nr:hypothetical protein DSO57_1006320 [Entomophthora muscae]